MAKTAAQSRVPGVFRTRHIIVLVIFLSVVAMFCAGYFTVWQRWQAAGTAKELYFDATNYLLQCTTGQQKFKFDSEDTKNRYITSAKKIGAGKQKKNSSFVVVLDKKSEKAIYVRYTKKLFIAGWVMEATGFYPAQSSPSKGKLRWYKVDPVKKAAA